MRHHWQLASYCAILPQGVLSTVGEPAETHWSNNVMAQAKPTPTELSETCSLRESAHILGVSLGSVYNLKKDPAKNFPPEVPLGLRNKRYRTDQIRLYAKYGPLWDQAGGA